MPGPVSLCRRFAASTRGVAAVEFAMILPVLLIMLLATFDGGNAIAIYMKVRSATYTLAAVTNQYTTMQPSDMTAVTGATAAVLAPYSSTPTVVIISQIAATSNTQAKVSWSYSVNGTALTRGATYSGLPTNLANNACGSGNYNANNPCYLIFAQVSYTFTPVFGYFGKGGITLSDSLYVTPRSVNCIIYNGVSSSC
jgi:Flp pilus assembly protein TadG